MNSYDKTPWWCQLPWPWSGPPWYAQIEDPAAWLAAIRRQFARQAGELAGDLAGEDRPGEGYLAKAGRLTAARLQRGREGAPFAVPPASRLGSRA